jgi:hypothetical protein
LLRISSKLDDEKEKVKRRSKKRKEKRVGRPPITRPEKKDGRTVCLLRGIGNCGCLFFAISFLQEIDWIMWITRSITDCMRRPM